MVRGLLARIRRDPNRRKLVRQGLELGRDVYLGRQVYIDSVCPHLIAIGDQTTIGMNTLILAHDNSMKLKLDHSRIEPVEIGARVYIGANVVVLPGATIGDDAVVGAGSIVSGDIPVGMLAAGNPARIIGSADDFASKHLELFARSGGPARPGETEKGYIR